MVHYSYTRNTSKNEYKNYINNYRFIHIGHKSIYVFNDNK